MRYFMEVLTLVIGVTLAGPVPEAAAAFDTAKHKRPYARMTVAGPDDVWARIRSGMGILRPAAADQAAVRSGSSAVVLKKRKHRGGGRYLRSSFEALPQTELVSDDSESSRPKFAPPRYTALGMKLLGAKGSQDNEADCVPFAAKRRHGNVLVADSETALRAWKEQTRIGEPHLDFRRQPALGSTDRLTGRLNGFKASARLSWRLSTEEGTVKTASRCAKSRSFAPGPGSRQPERNANRLEKQALPAGHPGEQAAIDPRIDKFIDVYTRNPDFLYRVGERARPYLYHIVEELSRYRLPLELALLPIVESAYRPTAESPKNAKGLWQFIPGTGIDYDLTQSRDYDERLDIQKSTQAAIRFLSGLYRHFNGDWLLALAAYNAGQAAVDNAVGRNRAAGLPADFWSLNLPRETKEYVPRLLALSAIFARPAHFDVRLPSVKNEPYFVKVKIDDAFEVNYLAEKKIAAIAGLADMPPDRFRRLNPGYLGTVLPRRHAYVFLLPSDNAVRLRRRLAGLSRNAVFAAEKPAANTGSYAPASLLAGDSAVGSSSGHPKFAVPFLLLDEDGEQRLPAEAGGF
ncbi:MULTISPECIES: transglycosylase SLT domain-containing protein [Methylomicrobium]|uniref:Soluble lytic murein transglycosylase-like protein n=1 Tax=Methylomicrobium album BG8 TaxID=686340 RepID=H8GIP3_METAL|nr:MULTISPECIES: transglycosylase SLT domain-containing protein [Methylomicrobium]EIC29070.1 soluble lytic murein transglycosylase-like protein [Methylomicrobium album BG8]